MRGFIREHRPVILVFLLALASRIAFYFVRDRWIGYGYALDSQFYVDQAAYLLKNHSFLNHGGGPLYTVLIAGFFGVFGQQVPFFICFQLLLGSFTAAASYYLTWTYFKDVRCATASGILFALDPFYIYFSSHVMSENLAIPLLVLFFIFFLKAWENGGTFRCIAAGMVLGTSLLCRSVLAGFVPFLPLCAWFMDRSRGLKKALFILFIAGLTILPWEVYLYGKLGRPVFIEVKSGLQLYQSLLPYGTDYTNMIRWHSEAGKSDEEKRVWATKDELYIDSYYGQRAHQWIRQNPGLFVRRAGEKFIGYWRPWLNPPYSKPLRIASGVYMLLLYALAITCLIKVRNPFHYFTITFIISVSLPFLIFFPQIRYRLPVHAMLLVLAGAGLIQSLDAWKRSG